MTDNCSQYPKSLSVEDQLKVNDKVCYCPPYVTRYQKNYEGVVVSIGKNHAWCKLGFGLKWCRKEDLVKI